MTALQLNSEFFAVITKEEFFRRIDEAKKGESVSFDNVEDLDKYIKGLRG